MKTYKPLTAGAIREPDDETRRSLPHEKNYDYTYMETRRDAFRWRKVGLVGRAILQSDLMIAEFRRPVEVMEE